MDFSKSNIRAIGLTACLVYRLQVKRLFSQWGQVQGGYCDVGDDELLDGQPFHGGYCVCDSIRNGRFKHPSATGYESKAYDYYFQGWAGARCEIPCGALHFNSRVYGQLV